MDIRIGITNSPREIAFESSQGAAEVEQVVSAALEEKSHFIKLADAKGKVYLVPVANLAYVEIGSEETRRVGFVG